MSILPLIRYVPHRLFVKAAQSQLNKAFEQGNWADSLTNMGAIDPAWVTFGGKPIAARLLPPSNYPPSFLLGASGYDGTLTLSTAVYAAQKKLSEGFLEAMVNELTI